MGNPALTLEQKIECLIIVAEVGKSATKVSKALGISPNAARNRINKSLNDAEAVAIFQEKHFKSRKIIKPKKVARPRTGVRRFIVTSAQDGTNVHKGFFENLKAYAHFLKCDILVGGFTYNKSLFEDHTPSNASFASDIVPYLFTDRVHVGDAVALCGEMNTLPTAVKPLSGLKAYTGDLWGVFPHAKIQLESVAQPKARGAKVNLTTGAITLPNYVPKKAGMKAQFHHIIAAVLIEVDSRGRVFPHHLIAEDSGAFYDMGRRIENGKITEGHRPAAIAWADIHEQKIDAAVALGAFGYDKQTRTATGQACLLDFLGAEKQIFHDLHDQARRNHHNIADPHYLFAQWCAGQECVETEIANCARFLAAVDRENCDSYVVESNHDQAFTRWLKTADYRNDPVNAAFFLASQSEFYRQIADGLAPQDVKIFEWAVRRLAEKQLPRVTFLQEDESLLIKGCECAHHGHRGANGSRGSLSQYANLATKSMIGHGHGPGVDGGASMVGVCNLEMGYNVGPSNWLTAHGLIYQNRKRALVFQYGADYIAQ